MAKLTDVWINRLKAKDKDYAEVDGAGLYLRVSRKGVKTSVYRYRNPQGRDVWLTIGNYRLVGPHEARKKVSEYALQRKQGIDPAEKLQAEKAAKQAEKDERVLIPTFENVTQLYYSRVISRHRRPEQFLWAMQKHVFPYIGKVRISELNRGQVAEVINRMVDSGTSVIANLVLAMVKGMTQYAVGQGHAPADPAAGLSRSSAGGKEKSRDRVLSFDEARAFMLALDSDEMSSRRLSTQVRVALLWLLLTGQRIGETLAVEWTHIKDGIWNIPADNTKSQRAHLVHLTPQLTALLHEVRPLTGDQRYIFAGPNESEKPINRFTVERALKRLLAR